MPFYPLTLFLSVLFINTEAWQCYNLLKQCTNNDDNLLDISKINSNNIYQFCENYTHLINPCLANEMNENPGDTYYERFIILRKCIDNDQSGQNDSEIAIRMIKILRLYLYGCLYSSMADLLESNCYNKLIKNCVEKTPTIHECYYWTCKSENYLTLKHSNVLLQKEDKKKDKNLNKTGDDSNEKWKIQTISSSVVPNRNYQTIKRNFTIYLFICLLYYLFFLSYTFI